MLMLWSVSEFGTYKLGVRPYRIPLQVYSSIRITLQVYGMVWHGMVWYGMVEFCEGSLAVPYVIASVQRHSIEYNTL